jgi:hypothetical protein
VYICMESSVTRSNVLTEGQKRHWAKHDAVAALVTRSYPICLKIPQTKNHALHCSVRAGGGDGLLGYT